MRIDPTATHRPTDVNNPQSAGADAPAEVVKLASADNKPRDHLVPERRRKNRRGQGQKRQGKGRRQGEQAGPQIASYQQVTEHAQPPEGPRRLVDIDC